MIALGFVVAVGLPLVVLVWAIVWPDSTVRRAEVERETHGGNRCRSRRGSRSRSWDGQSLPVGEGRYNCRHGCLGNVDPRRES